MDHVANGHTFTIPSQLGKPAMPTDFKAFADSMPPSRVEVTTANTVTDMVPFHKSRVVYFSDGGEYRVNDSLPVGGQVCVASYRGFVSVMGGSVEPASERLIPPGGLVVLTRVDAGLWLISKGSGGVGNYFNNATGGTVTEVQNYNGTGELWRVHTFTGNGSLDVLDSQQPFRVLVVGGGGGGGNAGSQVGGGGGRGGGRNYADAQVLTSGPHVVTVGGGGGRAGSDPFLNGGSGGGSSLGAISAGGGGGGTGNAGLGGTPPAPPPDGGTTYDITGTSTLYGQNGGPGSGNPNYGVSSPTAGGGGGGAVWGSGGGYNTGSGGGKAGLVIVAYQIG